MSLRLNGHVDQDKSDYPSFRVSEIITIRVSQSLTKFLYKQKDFLANLTKYDKLLIFNGWIKTHFCLSNNLLEFPFSKDIYI